MIDQCQVEFSFIYSLPKSHLNQQRSCLAETAAAENDLTGKPPGFVGGEKRGDQPNVLRHASSAQRSQRFDLVCDLLVSLHRTRALGVDYARVDGVHADVLRSEFLREHARNSVHRTL